MTNQDVEWLKKVVNRFCRRLPPRVDRGELLSDAYFAMAGLRERFDQTLGVPFYGFAFRRVIGAMQDGLRQRQSSQEQSAGCNDVVVERPLSLRVEFQLDRLTRQSRLTLQLHYLEQIELQTVAAIFGCTKARISQIHQRALRALRANDGEEAITPRPAAF